MKCRAISDDVLMVGDTFIMAVQECDNCGATACACLSLGESKPWRWFASGPDSGPDDDEPPCTGSSYDRHRALGLCGNCNEPALPGLATCERHRTRHEPGRHAKAVADGLCARCGRVPPSPGSQVCTECADRRNAQAGRRRERLIEHGKCAFCGGPNPTGTRRCDECRAKRRRKKEPIAPAPIVKEPAPIAQPAPEVLIDWRPPVPKEARKKICDECADLSHRRPILGCPVCHEPFEAERIERTSSIGSSGAAWENDG